MSFLSWFKFRFMRSGSYCGPVLWDVLTPSHSILQGFLEFGDTGGGNLCAAKHGVFQVCQPVEVWSPSSVTCVPMS